MWTVEKAPCHKARRAALCTAPPYTGTSHWATFCPSLPFLSGRQKGRKRDNHPQHPEAGVHWGSLERPCTENLPNANTACYNQNACSKKISTVQWQCFACCICQTEGAKTYSWLRRHKLYIFSLFPGCKESRVTIAIWCLSLQIQGKDVGGEPSAEGGREGGRCLPLPDSFLTLFLAPISTCLLCLQLKDPTASACQELRSWASSWQCKIEGLLQFCAQILMGRGRGDELVIGICCSALFAGRTGGYPRCECFSSPTGEKKKTKLLLKSYLRIEPEMKQRVSWIPQSSWDAI